MKKALYAHAKRRASAFDWVNNAILLLVALGVLLAKKRKHRRK